MIRTALEFVKQELDAYMVGREPDIYTTGNVVNVAPLMHPDNSSGLDANKHISLALVNVEEDRLEGKAPYIMPTPDKKYVMLNPPITLNLYLLFAAHSNTYDTALRDLSAVISFFQANPVFDEANYPNLNASVIQPNEKPWQQIERLSFTLHSMTFEQQNNLFSTLGTKHIPSVVYKVRMITIFETISRRRAEPITEIGIGEKSN